LVQIGHGLPPDDFQATEKDAAQMVKHFFNADSEEDVVQKIMAHRKEAWSLSRVCLFRSGHTDQTLRSAEPIILNRENMGRAIPFLTLAVPSHYYLPPPTAKNKTPRAETPAAR
jgi:hypothetical protein